MSKIWRVEEEQVMKAGKIIKINYTVWYKDENGIRTARHNYRHGNYITIPMTVLDFILDENNEVTTKHHEFDGCIYKRTMYQEGKKMKNIEITTAQEDIEDAIKFGWIEAQETTTDTDTVEEEDKHMFNNYVEAVTEDAAQYIRDNYTAEELAERLADRDEFTEELNDDMWVADEVTGNASGSYTFDRARAREYVMSDIDTIREALQEFCVDTDTIAKKFLNEDWEYFDVIARCYVLGQAIDAALDIIETETRAA